MERWGILANSKFVILIFIQYPIIYFFLGTETSFISKRKINNEFNEKLKKNILN